MNVYHPQSEPHSLTLSLDCIKILQRVSEYTFHPQSESHSLALCPPSAWPWYQLPAKEVSIKLRLDLNHGSGLYTEDVRDQSHLPLILLWTALDGKY